MAAHIVFDTALGFFALSWSDAGLTRVALAQPTRPQAEHQTARWGTTSCDPDSAQLPAFVVDAMARIRLYATGADVDFTPLPLDLSGIDGFRRAIYRTALKLRQGETTTYGGLAEQAGFPTMARETGQALGRNPLPLVVPCHRIVAAGGKLGGFSAPGGVVTKQRLLAHEHAAFAPASPAQTAFDF